MHNENSQFEFQVQASSPDQTPVSTEAPITADQITRIHQAVFEIFREHRIFEAVIETPEGPIHIGLNELKKVDKNGIYRGEVRVGLNPEVPTGQKGRWGEVLYKPAEKPRQAFRIYGFDTPEGRVIRTHVPLDGSDQEPFMFLTLADFANDPKKYSSGWILEQQ